MSNEELDKKWDEAQKENFNTFIRDNVGYKGESDQPSCFGTGDNRSYCPLCPYRRDC